MRRELCWRETQCEDRLVFVLSSDRADSIHFTHITLQNSQEPAKRRNSLTIAVIYDEKENVNQNDEILEPTRKEFDLMYLKPDIQITLIIPDGVQIVPHTRVPTGPTKIFKFIPKPFHEIKTFQECSTEQFQNLKIARDGEDRF